MEHVLKNDFYTIKQKEKADGALKAVISLNAVHAIFKGHFPQMPVVPGVCQAQIIKEILEEETGKKLFLHLGDNIKFTGMIIPTQHPEINLDLSYKQVDNEFVVDAKLFHETTIFTKYKGKFKIIS
jgi:3-hydroxyacyl-[acyl-carrier-protein] dehydratase